MVYYCFTRIIEFFVLTFFFPKRKRVFWDFADQRTQWLRQDMLRHISETNSMVYIWSNRITCTVSWSPWLPFEILEMLPKNQCISVEMLELNSFIQHGHFRVAVRLGEEQALLGLVSSWIGGNLLMVDMNGQWRLTSSWYNYYRHL